MLHTSNRLNVFFHRFASPIQALLSYVIPTRICKRSVCSSHHTPLKDSAESYARCGVSLNRKVMNKGVKESQRSTSSLSVLRVSHMQPRSIVALRTQNVSPFSHRSTQTEHLVEYACIKVQEIFQPNQQSQRPSWPQAVRYRQPRRHRGSLMAVSFRSVAHQALHSSRE